MFPLLALLMGCTGSGLYPLAPGPDEPPGFAEGQLCNARAVFEVSCVTGCHSGLVPEAGLDLATDPWSATVDVPGVNGGTLVVPSDSDGSLLYRKMLGVLVEGEGEVMPPTGALDPFFTDAIRAWITAGAPNDCELEPIDPPVVDPPDDETYHTAGWASANVHGLATNLQTDNDCRSCHGVQLDGGTSEVSCDSCHDVGWRTNCTFCHGGTLNATGAPPQDINNVAVGISFEAHSEHVAGADHPAYDCTECHSKPSSVLTPGHVFGDVTPGFGEISYLQGQSPVSTYLGGACSNVYCHGNGQADNGSVSDGDGPLVCSSCHPDVSSGSAAWDTMSGQHERHLGVNTIACSDCHEAVVSPAQAILDPTRHVNGFVDVQISQLTNVGGQCDGSCHGHNHDNDTW